MREAALVVLSGRLSGAALLVPPEPAAAPKSSGIAYGLSKRAPGEAGVGGGACECGWLADDGVGPVGVLGSEDSSSSSSHESAMAVLVLDCVLEETLALALLRDRSDRLDSTLAAEGPPVEGDAVSFAWCGGGMDRSWSYLGGGALLRSLENVERSVVRGYVGVCPANRRQTSLPVLTGWLAGLERCMVPVSVSLSLSPLCSGWR